MFLKGKPQKLKSQNDSFTGQKQSKGCFVHCLVTLFCVLLKKDALELEINLYVNARRPVFRFNISW